MLENRRSVAFNISEKTNCLYSLYIKGLCFFVCHFGDMSCSWQPIQVCSFRPRSIPDPGNSGDMWHIISWFRWESFIRLEFYWMMWDDLGWTWLSEIGLHMFDSTPLHLSACFRFTQHHPWHVWLCLTSHHQWNGQRWTRIGEQFLVANTPRGSVTQSANI